MLEPLLQLVGSSRFSTARPACGRAFYRNRKNLSAMPQPTLVVRATWLAPFLLGVLMALAGSTTVHAQPNQDALLLESLDAGVNSLKTTLDREVKASGGDIEHQGIHLIIGFSTGNFEKDPLAASAARNVATNLVKQVCAGSDRLTSCAWERDVWDRKGQDSTLDKVGDPSSLWPLTSNPRNTVGGHDTENAIVEITRDLGNAKNTIILLLTNTAASAGQPGIGATSPQYRAALEHWRRVAASTASGASLEIPYRVELANKSIQTRTIEAVIVLPKQFAGPSRPPPSSSTSTAPIVTI